MKKILVIFAFFMCIYNVNAISASSYVVMDMDDNKILDENNMNEKRLIASISKIMTCIIAIENGNLDDLVEAKPSILKATGSSIYIEVGEKIKLIDLLYGLMLRSGNDAAIMVADYISGSVESFSEKMNEYAKKIGMLNTVFVNSSGLESSVGANYSSAYDMALLTSYAYKNETFKKIFGTKNYAASSNIKTYHWKNKNKLLEKDFITGGKTGYTLKAKRTLVTTGSIENMNIVVVTLNDPNDWYDHLVLYENAKNNYRRIKIIPKDNLLIDDYYLKDDLYLTINKNDINKLNIKYVVNNYGAKALINSGSENILSVDLIKKKYSLFERIKIFLKNIF